jgi:hypothetical protein
VDYPHVSNAIYSFLVNSLRVRVVSLCPSALGAATVTFASCLDRQTAMGGPHRMEPYWLSFVPHDAGSNLRHLPLDRTCWLMLVNFPLECLSAQCIATAISSFGNLLHVGINRRLLLGLTVGFCWDRSSALAGIDRRLLLGSTASCKVSSANGNCTRRFGAAERRTFSVFLIAI